MQLRFASIEVNASKKVNSQSSSKSLAALKTNDRVNIHNEIKITTIDDATFGLRSEVISSHSIRELIDPDSMKNFKEIRGWKPENDEQLNSKFFKWMGNLSMSDHQKLAMHLLNMSSEQREQAYPKVTMKKIGKLL